MASSFKSPILQAIDQNGDPVPGAKLFVFATGTTTPVAVFSDEALSVALPNPIIANARGYFASAGGVVQNIFWSGQALRLRLTDPADAVIWEIDNYSEVTGATIASVNETITGDWNFTGVNTFTGDLVSPLFKPFADRAAAVAATIPDGIQYIMVISPAGNILQYRRGGAHVALTTNGGTVNWSPFGDFKAAHWADFNAALNSGAKRLIVDENTTLTADASVPATMDLDVPAPGQIILNTGTTLSFNNKARLRAARRRIFFGNGVPTNMRLVLPEWFGVQNSSTTEGDVDQAAWQRALDACASNAVVKLAGGFYPFNGATPLSCTKGQTFMGEGDDYATVVRFVTGTVLNFAAWTDTPGGGVKNMRFDGSPVVPTGGVMFKFTGIDAGRGHLKNVLAVRCWEFLNLIGTVDVQYNLFHMRQVTVYDIYSRLMFLNSATAIHADRVFTNANDPGAPAGQVTMTNRCEDVNFTNCNFSRGAHGLLVTNNLGTLERTKNCRWNTFTNVNFDGADKGVDIDHAEQFRFVNTWCSSNGRTIGGGAAGNGVHVRSNCRNIVFQGGVYSNNGQRGFRIDAGARDILLSDLECAGNSVNDDGVFYNIDVFGGTTDFWVKNCRIGGLVYGWDVFPTPPTRGAPAGGVQIRSGASDRYDVVGNHFVGLAVDITDNGTGTNKDVTTGNRTRATA